MAPEAKLIGRLLPEPSGSWILESCSTAFSVHTPLVRQPRQIPAIGPRKFLGRNDEAADRSPGPDETKDPLRQQIRSYHGHMSPLQKSVAGLFGSFLIPFCVLTTILAVIGKGDTAWQFAAFGVGVVCFVVYIDRCWSDGTDS